MNPPATAPSSTPASTPATATEKPALVAATLRDTVAAFAVIEAKIKLGGGQAAIDRQHDKGRLTARERVAKLIDPGTVFQEYGLWTAYGMYREYGGAPAAGVVTGVGVVQGRACMIIANDATVKAGAFFP